MTRSGAKLAAFCRPSSPSAAVNVLLGAPGASSVPTFYELKIDGEIYADVPNFHGGFLALKRLLSESRGVEPHRR